MKVRLFPKEKNFKMGLQSFRVESGEDGTRLDLFLARHLADRLSRSQVKKLIEAGEVRIGNSAVVSAHYKVKPGEEVQVEQIKSDEEETRAEAIPINIVYEDEDLLVVDKPAGMVVHPAHGNPAHTLVNALLFHVRNLAEAGGPVRPGIVHRLDKDTSGLLVVAKNNAAHFSLAQQFKDHHIDRTYEAIVRGVVQHDEGEIDEPVGRAFLNRKKVVVRPSGGKEALTYFRVRKRFKQATWLEIKPRTGRTHQIRVHLAHLGHPVWGDSFYGIRSVGIDRQALHASKLGFVHPRTHEKMSFESALPMDLQQLVQRLAAGP
jgi:23S rRNA pseudouridine1911/1915/1917 synthase